MTPQEFKLKLEQALLDLKISNKPLQLATTSALAEMSKRIFTDGQNSRGSAIGQYKADGGIYLNPKKSFGGSKLGTPRGKTGETKFKDGKPHVTVYLDSYKDYKSILGKPSGGGYVNLELSGDLKSDFENGLVRVNQNEYQLGLKRQQNVDKRDGLENKYGTVFFMTDKEIENFISDINFEFRKLFAA